MAWIREDTLTILLVYFSNSHARVMHLRYGMRKVLQDDNKCMSACALLNSTPQDLMSRGHKMVKMTKYMYNTKGLQLKDILQVFWYNDGK